MAQSNLTSLSGQRQSLLQTATLLCLVSYDLPAFAPVSYCTVPLVTLEEYPRVPLKGKLPSVGQLHTVL